MAAGTAVLAATGAPAGAHGTATTADPSPGGVVEDLDQIRLTFDEPLLTDGQFLVQLRDASGRLILTDGVGVDPDDPATVIAEPTEILGDGDYTLAYVVTFVDGEMTEDAYRFRIGDSGNDPPWTTVGIAVVVGGLALGALVWSRRDRAPAEPVS